MGKAGKIKGDGARQIVSVTELCVEALVCVCNNFCNILQHFFFYSLSISRGVTGVPGGSVTNEETSPAPVKTYPQYFGGAPGRIYVAAGGHGSPIYI